MELKVLISSLYNFVQLWPWIYKQKKLKNIKYVYNIPQYDPFQIQHDTFFKTTVTSAKRPTHYWNPCPCLPRELFANWMKPMNNFSLWCRRAQLGCKNLLHWHLHKEPTLHRGWPQNKGTMENWSNVFSTSIILKTKGRIEFERLHQACRGLSGSVLKQICSAWNKEKRLMAVGVNSGV